MVNIDFSTVQLQLKKEQDKVYVFDIVRRKWLILTPEEHVRQSVLYYLINTIKYPKGLLAVEKKIMVSGLAKRFDIVVYESSSHTPWMLIECKAHEVSITQATLHQLLSYHNQLQCNYWVLTNGHETYCADATQQNNIEWIDKLPFYNF